MSGPKRRRPVVAIDGPAGAGKSSVARSVAAELGFVLVDTGAIYRAVAVEAQRAGVPWTDGPALSALTEGLVRDGALVFKHVSSAPPPSVPPPSVVGQAPARSPGGVRVLLRGDDVTEAIRMPDIALGASTVSAHQGVRAALLELQRGAGREGGVVLEGRDIGTVVFPDAEVKFFLTAKPEERARRRHEELLAKGQVVTLADTLADVHQRDAQDTGRAVAPLRQAEDAIYVDSSELSPDEVVRRIVSAVRSVLARGDA